MLFILAVPAVSGCGGAAVRYAPIVLCGSVDSDPVDCRR